MRVGEVCESQAERRVELVIDALDCCAGRSDVTVEFRTGAQQQKGTFEPAQSEDATDDLKCRVGRHLVCVAIDLDLDLIGLVDPGGL